MHCRQTKRAKERFHPGCANGRRFVIWSLLRSGWMRLMPGGPGNSMVSGCARFRKPGRGCSPRSWSPASRSGATRSSGRAAALTQATSTSTGPISRSSPRLEPRSSTAAIPIASRIRAAGITSIRRCSRSLVAPLSLFDTESQVLFWYAVNVAFTFGCFGEARRLWRLVGGPEPRRFLRLGVARLRGGAAVPRLHAGRPVGDRHRLPAHAGLPAGLARTKLAGLVHRWPDASAAGERQARAGPAGGVLAASASGWR